MNKVLAGAMLSSPIFFAAAACSAADPDSDFAQRIANAKPGAVLTAPSNRMIKLQIINRTFKPSITIKGGTYTKVEIIDSSGVHLDTPTVQSRDDGDITPLIYLRGASSISITGATLRGNSKDVGISLRTVRDINVTGSSFDHLSNGLRGLEVDGLVVGNNRFRFISTDGIAVGGGSNLQIMANDITYVSSWTPTNNSLHPDAIQIWDDKRNPSRDIFIHNNTINVFGQGIFVKSEDNGGFDQVTISRNDITTDFANALTLTYSRNSRIVDNSVKTRSGTLHMAKIILIGNRDLVFQRNKACKMMDTNNEFADKRDIELNWQCPNTPQPNAR